MVIMTEEAKQNSQSKAEEIFGGHAWQGHPCPEAQCPEGRGPGPFHLETGYPKLGADLAHPGAGLEQG